jgi:chemotaxis protein MotB
MKQSTKAKLKTRIVVRKKSTHRPLRNHSAWKVAFADFTTAMMAFFLLMWLLQNTTHVQRSAIAGYFVEPGAPASGGSNADPAKAEYAVVQERFEPMPAARTEARTGGAGPGQISEDFIRREYQRRELAALEQLKRALEAELSKSDSVFDQLKGQIFVDINTLGLRVQIVDKAQRPMFDLGSDELKPYTRSVLHALAPLLNRVPNKISVAGHTDAVAFAEGAQYSNWELSVHRANSARRALLVGGYPEDKVAAAQGMGAVALFKPEAPNDPANRRIAIQVLKKAAQKSLLAEPDTDAARAQ